MPSWNATRRSSRPRPAPRRDYLTALCDCEGLIVELVDTAGVEAAADAIATQAQTHRADQAQRADLLLDCRSAEEGDPATAALPSGRPVLRVRTKCDLTPSRCDRDMPNRLRTSALTGEGVAELRTAVAFGSGARRARATCRQERPRGAGGASSAPRRPCVRRSSRWSPGAGTSWLPSTSGWPSRSWARSSVPWSPTTSSTGSSADSASASDSPCGPLADRRAGAWVASRRYPKRIGKTIFPENGDHGIMTHHIRIETDTMGGIEVPADRLWGAQTQRSLENFKIGEDRDADRADPRSGPGQASRGPGQSRPRQVQGPRGRPRDHRGRRRGHRRPARRRVPPGRLADRQRHPDEHEPQRGHRQPGQRADGRRTGHGPEGPSQRPGQHGPVVQRRVPDGHARGRRRSAPQPSDPVRANASRHPGPQGRGIPGHRQDRPDPPDGRDPAHARPGDLRLGAAPRQRHRGTSRKRSPISASWRWEGRPSAPG